ncbi:diguanylate cyclase [Xanthomonadaceae bacterium JHOS43]|nr:diguanylate cyclase [Xanthomonadaceae bacterium JHOS43]MCX7564409.1 diguanylate cyclase [Xanthomonadaceae bacterium XH05]
MARLFHAVSAALLLVSGVVLLADVRGAPRPAETFVTDAEKEGGLSALSGSVLPDDAGRLDAAGSEETYLRLRRLAIAGDQVGALRGLIDLLESEMPAELRMRVYVTAISVATNIEEWPTAFALLNESMEHLPAAPENASVLMGAASHLHTQVGDIERAVELAKDAVQIAEASRNDFQICRAAAALAFAHEAGDTPVLGQQWRERQIDYCKRANDPLFIANGEFGLSKILSMQGRYAEALEWGEKALADHLAHNYEAGANNAREIIARSLIALRQDLPRVETLLASLSSTYREHNFIQSLAEVEMMWADLTQLRGEMEASARHLREAMKHERETDRGMRARQLAYFQIQFSTQLKEQQISLLETEKALAEATSMAAHRRQLLLGISVAGLLVTAILLSLLLRRTLRDRQRYRWEAEHDGLTGLINQQHLYKLGTTAFSNATQQSAPFTAVALDIDLFKQINDSHGHAAGDTALQSLGVWIRSAVGSRGIAARRGGDEFMILLNADQQQARTMLQRLRERITPITAHDRTFRITVSAGICQADAKTASLAQLLHQADQALYRAKQQGRDRSVCWQDELPEVPASAGSLVVVGSGIQFGRHVSERTLSEIQQAEVVFCLADPFALAMISSLRPDVINLGTYYAPGKDRRDTYREIDTAIMCEVLAGKAVCAVFYGHPGVFADVPHRVIRKTRAAGLAARMEPGISAEACLYADLGIDPGQRGVQSLEATHFLYYDRQPDPQGLVLLWQVALAGDWSCRRLHAEREGLQALVTKLQRWYPPDHEVILYEAAQLPIDSFRAEALRLCDLPDAHYKEFTTLVIPALKGDLVRDAKVETSSVGGSGSECALS